VIVVPTPTPGSRRATSDERELGTIEIEPTSAHRVLVGNYPHGSHPPGRAT
jgi:hypothetical protein